MTKSILLAPGPTQVPEAARLAMARTLIHHRTPAFTEVMLDIGENLRWLYQTEQQVLALTCSGTGAFEAAMINFTRKEDTIICIGGGKFGERWAEVGRAYGMNVIDYALQWGDAATVEGLTALLEQHPSCAMVTISASETSAGVFHPIEQLAKLIRTKCPQTLFAVDGITAVGVHPLPMDAWDIDILVTGSQKALSVPPGMAFVAASERAWARHEHANHPRYYLDLGRELKKQKGGQTAFTPAITVALALQVVLQMMRQEGHASIYARHELHSRACRAAVEALGLTCLTDSPTFATTAALVPEGIVAPDVVQRARDVYGVTMAGGQEHLKPRLIRVGHLGFIEQHDVLAGLAALEKALNDCGHQTTPGAGVQAAQSVYLGSV